MPHPQVKFKAEVGLAAMSSSKPNVTSPDRSTLAGGSSAIVLRKKDGDLPDRLISDEMGSKVVAIYIGEQEFMFNIHRNLIRPTSAFFSDVFENDLPNDQRLALKEEDPAVFKLFIDFLYTKRIPSVTASMPAPAQALRAKQLCQLYAFCDRFHLNFEIRNRVMDRIQDAFLVIGKFPEPGLVQAIYTNSLPESKLRQFAMAGVYCWFRSAENLKDEEFKALLRNNTEVLNDFLEHVRCDSAGQDPRIRQCHGWEGCNECAERGHARIEGLGGTFPCEFHVHKGLIARAKKGSKGPAGTNTEDVELSDDGCYCWSIFPDMAWMEKHVLKVG